MRLNKNAYDAVLPDLLVGGVLWVLIRTIFKRIEGKSIAVLGMQGAGKTHMLANMQDKEYIPNPTIGVERYERFSISKEGRDMIINSGKDIGGGVENCSNFYESMIKDSDIVFFLFDAYKYLSSEEYQKDAQARLDFIHRKTKVNQVAIFATHRDQFESIKMSDSPTHYATPIGKKLVSQLGKKHVSQLSADEARVDILRTVYGKPYLELFKNNFCFLDMRDINEFRFYWEKIII